MRIRSVPLQCSAVHMKHLYAELVCTHLCKIIMMRIQYDVALYGVGTGAKWRASGSFLTSSPHAALAFQLPRARCAAAAVHASSKSAAPIVVMSELMLVRVALTLGSSMRPFAMYDGSPLPRWGDQWPASQPPPVWFTRS